MAIHETSVAVCASRILRRAAVQRAHGEQRDRGDQGHQQQQSGDQSLIQAHLVAIWLRHAFQVCHTAPGSPGTRLQVA